MVLISIAGVAWQAGGYSKRGTGDDVHVFPVRSRCEGIAQRFIGTTGHNVHMDYYTYQAMALQLQHCNQSYPTTGRLK